MKRYRPLTHLRNQLKTHGTNQETPNPHMIRLMYAKGVLSSIAQRLTPEESLQPDHLRKNQQPPVFILGHWRSGTTFLQFLLNQDPGFFTLSKFQAFFPDCFPVMERSVKPLLQKLTSLTQPVHEWQQNLSKSMDMDSPSESEMGLITRFFPYTYHWAHFFPQSWWYYFRHYLFLEDLSEEAYRSWLEGYGAWLHKRCTYNEEGALLVKNPGDTGRIRHLLKLYPNARFIFIHRHPYEVYYSNHRLWNNVQNSISLEKLSSQEQEKLILEVYSELHKAYLEQKSLLAHDQLVEIAYEDLMNDTENTLAQIYGKLNLNGFNNALPYFRSYIQENMNWQDQKYPIDHEVFAKVKANWDFAFKEWGYHKPGPDLKKVG